MQVSAVTAMTTPHAFSYQKPQAQPQPLKASQTDSFTPSTAESRSGRGVSKMTIVELVLGAIILKVLPGCTEMSKTLPVQSVKNWEEAVLVKVSNLPLPQQRIFADSLFETLKCKGTGGRSSNLTLEGVEQPIKTGLSSEACKTLRENTLKSLIRFNGSTIIPPNIELRLAQSQNGKPLLAMKTTSNLVEYGQNPQ